MKILISYSKDHFDPTKPENTQKYWGSSASILARSLYSILKKKGEVTYIDRSEVETIRGKEFDFFIGIADQFSNIKAACSIKKSVLFAVNMHPLERKSIFDRFMSQENIGIEALSGYEFIDNLETLKAIQEADHILCVGNIATYNSYLKHGVSKQKIKILNYGILEHESVQPLSRTAKRHYVYVASDIGLRKGFDIVEALFLDESLNDENFHIDIIGKAISKRYQDKLIALQQKLGSKATIHGWVDSKDTKYANIIARNDFIVYPSLEEGQAGTVLEALSLGVIPVLSCNTGIDYSPLGALELDTKSSDNRSILHTAQTISEEDIARLKSKTKEYYAEFHAPFVINLERSLEDCIAGSLYPEVGIILSVFNKEKTIIQLIKLLDKACIAYGNVDMQIILDGCHDKSEKLVRDFYAKRPYQKVSFYVTPNIFEVKSNNIGLQNTSGRYCVIIQDDNLVYDKNFLFEAVLFLEKNPKAAVLGGLAGVNFYPRGTALPTGPGQVCSDKDEAYWRQDKDTDPDLVNKVFEVDACMRGPLIFTKAFLERHGYLDEIYAPLHQDDMDLCFRAKNEGFKVYAMLMNVENTEGTVANYSPKMAQFHKKMRERNTGIFYSRWTPSHVKDYLSISRTPLYGSANLNNKLRSRLLYVLKPLHTTMRWYKRIANFLTASFREDSPMIATRKILSKVVRKVAAKLPWVQYHLVRVAWKIYSSDNDREDAAREVRERPWNNVRGDSTLRLEYDLNEDSVVVDVGGYHGHWASDIFNMYACTVHVFEPVEEFANIISNRFKHNKKIVVHPAALGTSTDTSTIYLERGGTSLVKKTDTETEIQVLDAHTFITSLGRQIDVMKINIEGAEYDLLEHIVTHGDTSCIKNIQIQFHAFVPNAVERRERIQSALSKTHRQTYNYDFVWENWTLK